MTQRSNSERGPGLGCLQWQSSGFDSLSAFAVHAAFRLRSAVFVVEQNCVYQDIDGLDPVSWHLLGWQPGEPARLAAYLRIVPPGARFDEPSIGRVVVHPQWRNRQLGRALMTRGIKLLLREYPGSAIRISAQRHLSGFYESLGFEVCSAPYREDDIPHVQMLRPGDG